MKSGLKSRGFTIVEVLIFLAVSSALMVSAFTLITGLQNKTSFTQGINDVQQQIDSVINNVTNGYYAESSTQQTCLVIGGAIDFQNGSSEKGTNSDCIFLGRMIVFGNDETYTVYNIAGKRQSAPGKEVTKMSDAAPIIIPNSEQTFRLKNGILFNRVKSDNKNAYAFINGLGTSTGISDQLASGYQQAGFYAFPYTAGNPLTALKDRYDSDKNPTSGYNLCFDSGTTNQNGLISLGGDNRNATSSLQIRNGPC